MQPKPLPLGIIYNQLTVIDNTLKLSGSSACICRCSCGNITKPIRNYALTSGNTKSCGCLALLNKSIIGRANVGKPSKKKGIKLIESIKPGTIFGKLTIIALVGQTKCGHNLYNCLCSCGNNKVINKSRLLSGNTKSCGCLRIEHIQKIKQLYRISKGFDPDVLMSLANELDRNKLNKISKQVKQRDNFTCVLCSGKGKILHTHHIIPFSQNIALRLDPKNLITLCKRCHIDKAHSGNFTGLNKEIQLILQEKIASLY
jgi:hypothetical protein